MVQNMDLAFKFPCILFCSCRSQDVGITEAKEASYY